MYFEQPKKVIFYYVHFIDTVIMANERLDFVIFGATGFTGKEAVKVAAQLAKEKQITFGVSGRRKQALEAVVKEFAPDIGRIRCFSYDTSFLQLE